MTAIATQPKPAEMAAADGRWLSNPQHASEGLLVVVAFARSPAKSFPMTLGIAKTATHFGVTEIEGQEVFVAGFEKNQADANAAAALVDRIKGWQNTLFFASGQVLRNPKHLLEYLRCFSMASACDDPKAHCHVIMDDPGWTWQSAGGIQRVTRDGKPLGVDIPTYTFPCRLLFKSFALDSRIPISYIDQTQAAAVRHGLHTCPCFNAGETQPHDKRPLDLIPEALHAMGII